MYCQQGHPAFTCSFEYIAIALQIESSVLHRAAQGRLRAVQKIGDAVGTLLDRGVDLAKNLVHQGIHGLGALDWVLGKEAVEVAARPSKRVCHPNQADSARSH